MTTAKPSAVHNILDRCVCLLLSCGNVGVSRSMDASSLKMEKDGAELASEKRRMAVSKQLVDSAELRGCAHVIKAAKNYLASMSAARSHRVFGAGTYLIPYAAVEEVEGRLVQFELDLRKHAAELAARWPAVIESSREALGKIFNAAEFPTAEDVLSQYELDWSYVKFGSPERLEEVNHALADRSREKWEQKLRLAHEEVVTQLRGAALQVMQDLADRLRPDEHGKVRALRPTALRDLNELLQRLPVLNISDDAQLVDMLAPVGAVAQGLQADVLNSAPAVRAMLLAKAEEACDGLSQLVSAAGKRSVSFGPVG